MKTSVLTLAVTASLSPLSTFAEQAVEQEIEGLRQRLDYLEQRVRAQDEAIGEKDEKFKTLEEGPSVEVGALVEFEAGYAGSFDGASESDLVLATAEIGLAAEISDSVSADVTLLYQDNGEEPLDVDVASFTVAGETTSVVVGQIYVPFGVFDTNLVSDPLTLDLGETRETALQGGFGNASVAWSAYLFRGDNQEDFGASDDIDNFGLSVTFGAQNSAVSATLGYINDIRDSNGIQNGLDTNDVAEHVAGLAFSTRYETDRFVLIGEYIDALDAFAPGELPYRGVGAEPAAWNLEAGIPFALAGQDAMFAFGVQGTEEALALELPERRLLAALSIPVRDGVTLSVEWAHDTDYDESDGGTGRRADTVTAQLAVEF
ncbi:MAG: LbtU family siderophore porin [Proteobacteria bacterium]|nr:MAG: LbtU family siderophore porin [Pseudomonadota bacterium]